MSLVGGMVLDMRTVLVFEVEIDEGKRPSTRFRRVDRVVRVVAEFMARLREVRAVRSISVCDPEEAERLSAEVRYDGRQLAPPTEELPVPFEVR